MRYAVYLLQLDNSYRDLEAIVEADSPREAAQQVFDQLGLHPDEEFPQLLVVPDEYVSVFTRNDAGRAITVEEDGPRMIAKGPRYGTVIVNPDELGEAP